VSAFTELAAAPDPSLDRLALALAAEFRAVDERAALAQLDVLGAELRDAAAAAPAGPEAQTGVCAAVLGSDHGFRGDEERYDHPDNSMLDVVLARRRGLPILLSVVYVEVARRAGIPLAGVGLAGHFVVGHFGADPPLLIDPFAGGRPVEERAPVGAVRPWTATEIALRMLNNLVASYRRRGDLAAAIRAADLRLALPSEPPLRDAVQAEARALRARLN
jgi:regulator of sirC expression with transglutaminase-like and TPR domain